MVRQSNSRSLLDAGASADDLPTVKLTPVPEFDPINSGDIPVRDQIGSGNPVTVRQAAICILRRTWWSLFIVRHFNPVFTERQIMQTESDGAPGMLLSLCTLYTSMEEGRYRDAVLAVVRHHLQDVSRRLTPERRKALVNFLFGYNNASMELYCSMYPDADDEVVRHASIIKGEVSS